MFTNILTPNINAVCSVVALVLSIYAIIENHSLKKTEKIANKIQDMQAIKLNQAIQMTDSILKIYIHASK
jgi:hypothetical protein